MVTNFKTSKGEFAFVKESNITEGTKKFYNFEVIGFTQALTEEQWSEVLDDIQAPLSNDILGYQDYLDYGYSNTDTATESGKTLMQSLGLKGNNWLLIKYL